MQTASHMAILQRSAQSSCSLLAVRLPRTPEPELVADRRLRAEREPDSLLPLLLASAACVGSLGVR